MYLRFDVFFLTVAYRQPAAEMMQQIVSCTVNTMLAYDSCSVFKPLAPPNNNNNSEKRTWRMSEDLGVLLQLKQGQ